MKKFSKIISTTTMTSISSVVLLLTILGLTRTENMIVRNLIEDFYSRKLIRQVTVFGCWNNFETARFNRELMNSGLKTGFVSIPTDDLDMRRILTVNYYKLGVVLDLDCPGSNRVLEQFTEQNIPFNESYSWLLVTNETMPKNSFLRTLPLTIETELVVAVSKADDTFELFDVYNPSYRHGGDLNVTYMGQWDRREGLTVNLTQYKYERRGDLRGLSLNVSIAITHKPTPDFMTYISYPIDRHLDTMHRFNYALVRQLRDYYNFKMNLMKATSWGYLVNGTFNGMLGDMISGQVDLGATPLQFKKERIDVAEFTVQTWLARPCFIFRHPKKSSVRNGFLRPFAQEVWVLIFFTAAIYWILLWIAVKVDLHLSQRKAESTLDIHTVSESALIVTASLCQQGLTEGPRLYSGRINFIFLFVWGLLLFQFYSASIVGSLLGEPPRYINTLKDILDSDLRIGIEDIAYNYDYFATTTDPVSLKLYKKKVAPTRSRKKAAYYSPEEGLRRVQKGKFAFHVDVATAYKIITDTFSEDEICDLVEIQLFPPKHTATVTSKHSPFKKMVTYGMRQIIERGMGERLRHVWHHRRPRCPDGHNSIPVPVSLEEFSPALFLLTIGMAIAGFIIFGEKHAKSRIPKIREDEKQIHPEISMRD